MKTNLLIVSQRGLPRCSCRELGLPLLEPKFSGAKRGFTRLELAAVVGSVLLLLAVALPAVANKARSQQVGCFNNLRQIGRAFHLWGNDHGDQLPFFVPAAEGGTAPASTTAMPWFQFSVLAKELGTPQLLACPSDTKHPASEFSGNPEKGLLHANFRNSAVSYFLGEPRWPLGHDVLSGDSNLRVDGQSTCSTWGSSVASIAPRSVTAAQWTNSLHVQKGNFLYLEGSVEQLDNQNLVPALRSFQDDNGSIHLLMP